MESAHDSTDKISGGLRRTARPRQHRLLAAAAAAAMLAIGLPASDAAADDKAAPAPAPSAAPAAAPASLPRSVQGLDPSGETIPKTNYAIPSKGVVYMSTTGNDTNPGTTKEAPVRTLNQAYKLVPEGGTIVLRGGTYRDSLTNPDADITNPMIATKSFTLQAYPNEAPWLDGSNPVRADKFTKESGNTWSIRWSTGLFCQGRYYDRAPLDQNPNNSGPCAYADIAVKGPGDTLPSDPQQAFVDGVEQVQVASLGSVRPGTFYYDWKNRRLHIGTDPATARVELTARPKAMILGAAEGKQPKRAIKGIGVRRYASIVGGQSVSGSPNTSIAKGAIYIGNGSTLIENSVFTSNAATGLAISEPQPGTIIRRSVFARNGDKGIGANGESKLGKRSDIVIENNIFDGNVWAGLGAKCVQSCGQAGVKLANMIGFQMTGNLVQNGGGNGLWCDLGCSEGVYAKNVIRNITGKGLYHEVSDTGIIAGNVVDRSGSGISVAGTNSKVYNNTVINITNGVPISVYDDPRSGPGFPDTRNNSVHNNLIAGQVAHAFSFYPVVPEKPVSGNTLPAVYLKSFDDNTSLTVDEWQAHLVWIPTQDTSKQEYYFYKDLAKFREKYKFERRSVWAKGVTARVVPRASTGNYEVRDTPETRSDKRPALPPDVAKVLGVGPESPPLAGAPWRG